MASAVADITHYLDGLPQAQRDQLYESPWTCQAVLRSLPPLAKQYVLRLVFTDIQALPIGVVNSWSSDLSKYGIQHREALDKLEGLGLLVPGISGQKTQVYQVHQAFRAQLLWSLAGGGQLAQELPSEVVARAPRAEDLDAHAHAQWEALQLYILTNESPPPAMPSGVPCAPLDLHSLLVTAKLVSGSPLNRAITDLGFQFLLKDNFRQLWTFLTEYIHDAERKSGGELASVISFLMQLGFRRVGQPCAFSSLSVMEQAIAGHMMQLGLLLPFKVGSAVYFCPTRLASSLCGGAHPGAASANADIAGGHILVETNYRVYAYTSSQVQRALLEIFCRTDYILPNLYVGTLNRDSVRKALESGISSEGIISYLLQHAHPHVAHKSPVVPAVVTDQIRLWEAELHRLKIDVAYIYEAFESPALYEQAVEFVSNQGLLLWQDPAGKMFAAKEEGHDRVKAFIRKTKEALMIGV